MNGRLTEPDVMALPMTRRDISDYLGLTIETVSRSLTALKRKGFLKLTGAFGRNIMVLDPAGLAEIAG
jgi:CRP/FNR family nitrogen fixation transcriptional regulator